MDLKIIALGGSHEYATTIADIIGTQLVETDEFLFDDGECFVAPKENIRGCDVFIIQSLYTCRKESLHEKLMKLLMMCGASYHASASRITLVMPYFCYGRQDRKTKPRAPITTKYMANMIESVYANRILAMDVHNMAVEQNAFDIQADLLTAKPLFVEYILKNFRHRPIALLSPDDGGMDGVTEIYSSLSKYKDMDLKVAGCMYKTHVGSEITGHDVMGVVEGRDVLVLDDMISSGKTICECAKACRRRGANRILAVFAPHGLFVGNADENLADPFIERIVVTDTVSPYRLKSARILDKLTVLPTTSLFAQAITCIHRNRSVTGLFDFTGKL